MHRQQVSEDARHVGDAGGEEARNRSAGGRDMIGEDSRMHLDWDSHSNSYTKQIPSLPLPMQNSKEKTSLEVGTEVWRRRRTSAIRDQ